VYALSAAPVPGVPPEQVTRDVLLAAMKGRILATAELSVVYSRGDAAEGTGVDRRGGEASALAAVGKHVFMVVGGALVKVDGEALTIVKTLDLPSSRSEDRPREGQKGE
jgi:hypothetical protein